MFIWARVHPDIGSSEKLSDYLLYQKHIFVTPGFVFGEKGKNYVRASLCVKQKVLEKVLERLESFDISEV